MLPPTSGLKNEIQYTQVYYRLTAQSISNAAMYFGCKLHALHTA